MVCESSSPTPSQEDKGLRRMAVPAERFVRPRTNGTQRFPRVRGCLIAILAMCWIPFRGFCQESPYIVTYDHHLEEPGNLEIETKSALARPEAGHHFGALATELEYGARAWWTTELYLDGQATRIGCCPQHPSIRC